MKIRRRASMLHIQQRKRAKAKRKRQAQARPPSA
jgi:hypothetical protein